MKPVLVLGIGSRLMMDDGIGVYVVEALAERSSGDKHIDYRVGETDFEYCMELAEEADQILIVDAAETGKNPGDLTVYPIEEYGSVRSGISQHSLHFLDLLCHPGFQRKGALIGIEPFRVDFHLGLSTELAQVFDQIVTEVKRQIDKQLRSYLNHWS